MEAVLVKIGLVLLYIVLFSCLILTVLGLAGNWVLVGAALIIKLTGLGDMTWTWFGVTVGLAALGELVESLLGLVVVARKGGTRWGVLGSFVGGLAGAVLGAGVVPPVGSLLFGFLGAFGGAALGEYLRARQTHEALRVGFWSFVGRTFATAAKIAVGVAIVVIIILRTW